MKSTVRILTLGSLALAVMALLLLAATGMAKPKGDETPWIGVYIQTVDAKMAKSFDLPDDYGVVINKVVEDSPAEKAGLVEEDVVVAFDNTPVRTADELRKMVSDSRPGETVKLTIYRDGKRKQLTMDIGTQSNADQKKQQEEQENWGVYMPKSGKHSFRFMERERPYMGVTMSDLSDQLGDYFGVKKGRGALITSVEEDSPAEKAGLKAGDVIVGINDEKVTDPSDASMLVGDMEEGDTATVAIIRDKKNMSVKVEIGETKGAMNLGNLYWTPRDDDDLVLDLPSLKRSMPDIYRFKGEYQSEEFQQEMDQLRKDLEQLKQELKDLKKDLR